MPTPSGQISLGNVNTELGLSATALITMNDAAVRTLAGVGGSGTVITMQNLQNKSNRVTASATISANTSNYTLNTAKAPGYSSGKTDMTLTINSGIFVSSSSTGTAAFIVDTSWAAGDTVTVVNNGTIVGRGGAGGAGGNTNFFNGSNESGKVGAGGGLGLQVQRAITLNNVNRIAGGGGGGGGSGSFQDPNFTGLGGGGGGGIGNGTAGAIGSGPSSGGAFTPPAAQAGSLTAGGAGSPGALLVNAITCFLGESSSNYSSTRGAGGTGGTYGSSGATSGVTFSSTGGCPGSFFSGGQGGGGAAGGAISGNSNITYTNTGTRNGAIT
jgi:hypothetical protein